MTPRGLLMAIPLFLATSVAAKDLSPADQWLNTLETQIDEIHEAGAKGDVADKEWVKARIGAMAQADQLLRASWASPEYRALPEEEQTAAYQGALRLLRDWDKAHVKELKKILKEHSWIRISEFGARADADAWLVVQHADHDVKFQREVLDVMASLVTAGETRPVNYAYLFDRVAVGEGKKQMFGTQGKCNAAGAWEPLDLADPDNVDARRVPYQMEPLEIYVQQASAMCR